MRKNNNGHATRPIRVYLVGSHATGKTTLARWISEQFGIPMIAEVARGVLAEMEAHLDALRSNVEMVNRYQAKVFSRQIECEQKVEGHFVSDRAFCNLAYAAHHSTIMGEIFRDPRMGCYMDWVREGIVFFLRPHRELVRADGVRAGLEWEEVVRIDGMVKLFLEMYDIPYIPVESLSMQERVRTVQRVLELGGLTQLQNEKILPTDADQAGVILPAHSSGQQATETASTGAKASEPAKPSDRIALESRLPETPRPKMPHPKTPATPK